MTTAQRTKEGPVEPLSHKKRAARALLPTTHFVSTEEAHGSWIRAMFALGAQMREENPSMEITDLALGQPFPVDPSIVTAFTEALHRPLGSFGYMPNSGFPDVREAIATWADLPMQCIYMTPGAGPAMCLALRAFVEPGSEVLGVAPHFAEFATWTRVAGSTFVPLDGGPIGRLTPELLERSLTPQTRALILNSPSNPTGYVFTGEDLAGLAAVLTQHEATTGVRILVIVDEVYRQLVIPPTVAGQIFDYWDASVAVRSFSKDLGLAGERIGYLALHPLLGSSTLISQLETTARALAFTNAPATAQRALLALPTLTVDPAPLATLVGVLVDEARARGLHLVPPQGGIYLWIETPRRDATKIAQEMARRGVLVAPGIAFGRKDHVRICITRGQVAVVRGLATLASVAQLPVP